MQWCLSGAPSDPRTIALVSPLIAIVLTLVTMSVLFAILGKNPLDGALRLFHRSAAPTAIRCRRSR